MKRLLAVAVTTAALASACGGSSSSTQSVAQPSATGSACSVSSTDAKALFANAEALASYYKVTPDQADPTSSAKAILQALTQDGSGDLGNTTLETGDTVGSPLYKDLELIGDPARKVVLAYARCLSLNGETVVPGATAPPTQAAAKPNPCTSEAPTATAPAGSTTDLKKKPVVKKPTAKPPCALQTIDIVVGKGAAAKSGDMVTMKYVGLLYATDKEFDSSWSRGATSTFPFTLGGGMVIPGFDKGVLGMKVGGRREIIIPAADGYGAAGSPPTIPANADLIFVVDLVKIGK